MRSRPLVLAMVLALAGCAAEAERAAPTEILVDSSWEVYGVVQGTFAWIAQDYTSATFGLNDGHLAIQTPCIRVDAEYDADHDRLYLGAVELTTLTCQYDRIVATLDSNVRHIANEEVLEVVLELEHSDRVLLRSNGRGLYLRER